VDFIFNEDAFREHLTNPSNRIPSISALQRIYALLPVVDQITQSVDLELNSDLFAPILDSLRENLETAGQIIRETATN
jgi:hypothetical protein